MTLIQRIEQADGPCRELDAVMRLAVLGDCPYGVLTGRKHQAIGIGTLSGYVEAYRTVLTADDALDEDVVPRYSASIDAALTLVGDNCWKVEDHPMAGPCAVVDDQDGYARTPALALCAAALRARENQHGR